MIEKLREEFQEAVNKSQAIQLQLSRLAKTSANRRQLLKDLEKVNERVRNLKAKIKELNRQATVQATEKINSYTIRSEAFEHLQKLSDYTQGLEQVNCHLRLYAIKLRKLLLDKGVKPPDPPTELTESPMGEKYEIWRDEK